MPKFDPKTAYTIIQEDIKIEDFTKYADEYVVRPPYQRKSVWNRKKQQALMDSLFRRYYVPHIVIREVRIDDERTLNEVIDGQQRITTVQNFLNDALPLPKSLADVHPELPNSVYSKLPSDLRRFIDDRLKFKADIVKGIAAPNKPEHQNIATEIFWRLQQGESLNYMEIAHSRLSSLVRNFVVKYADDQRFDFNSYRPIDSNADKHKFFSLISRGNDRMQHLAILTRLLMLEDDNWHYGLKDSEVMTYIDNSQQEDGVGNFEYEKEPHTKRTLGHMTAFYTIFKDDDLIVKAKVLNREYFIISVYWLLRHLRTNYVFDSAEQALFRTFIHHFHQRWSNSRGNNDTDLLLFSESRQTSVNDIDNRHRIIRHAFFTFAAEQDHTMLTKDDRRAFSESDRIEIYRRDNGLCQYCHSEGKPEKEARVDWSEYDADHVIPHSKGGQTDISNGQVLCRHHNRSKGAKAEAVS